MDKKAENLQAVGISYESGKDTTPYISSKGSGERAQAIVDMANELGLYVHRDEGLLNQLLALREGEEVPQQLYGIIATVLAFSYMLQGRTPDKWKRPDGSTAINTKA